jgi:restriction endonuclease S subunit
VYQKETRIVIASANLIVIRPKGAFIGGYIKLFLESPVGIAMIKSFQRGTSVMNLNHSDIMEMEIPTLPLEKQREMVELYRTEREAYKGKIQQAENTWNNVKERLYSQLIKEKDG